MSFSNISEARAYLVKTAYPGSTMTRQGSEVAIGRLNPAYAVKLANAIETARAQGIKAGVYSAFRTPQATGSAFDKSGQSLHSYGLATDISGIGGAGSATAKAWYKIATDAGIYNPYGYKNPREFNHFQGVPDKSAPQALRGTLNRDGTPKLGADGNPVMWAAARLPAYAADGQKLPSEDIPNPAAPAQPALRYTPGRAKMSGPAVADVQRKLDAAGFDPGPSDGVYGPKTAAAVRAFENATPGLTLDKGVVGPQVREALNNASPVPVTAGIADMIHQHPPGAPSDFSIANPNPPQRLQEGAGVVQVPDRQLDVPASRPTGGPGQVPTSAVASPGFPPVWGEQPQPFSGPATDIGDVAALAQRGNGLSDRELSTSGFGGPQQIDRGAILSSGPKTGAPYYNPLASASMPQSQSQGDAIAQFGGELGGAIAHAPSAAVNGLLNTSDALQNWIYGPSSASAAPTSFPAGPGAGLSSGMMPQTDFTGAQLGLTNAESGMWNAFGNSGNSALADAYRRGLGDSGDYLGGIGGVTPSSAPSASPTTMQGATQGDIFGGGSDNTLRGSDGGISSDWQSFLSPPASVANVVHPAQDYTMPAAGDFNGPGVTAAGEHQPDFSSAAPDALPNDSLAGDPLGQVAAYDAAKAATGWGAPKAVPGAQPARVVASPSVPPQVAARAYGPTNSGYGTRYQAPANWGWGNSANAARSAGYTTGIASPQYAQIAASRGYSAPADAFTPGSGGAIYAYHANQNGGGTYVDSQGREHTY